MLQNSKLVPKNYINPSKELLQSLFELCPINSDTLTYENIEVIGYDYFKHESLIQTICLKFNLNGKTYSIPVNDLMQLFKDWLIDMEQSLGIHSHRIFYTQTDSYEWYSGISKVHTTYDEGMQKINDYGKDKVEFNSILKMAENILKEKLKGEKDV